MKRGDGIYQISIRRMLLLAQRLRQNRETADTGSIVAKKWRWLRALCRRKSAHFGIVVVIVPKYCRRQEAVSGRRVA